MGLFATGPREANGQSPCYPGLGDCTEKPVPLPVPRTPQPETPVEIGRQWAIAYGCVQEVVSELRSGNRPGRPNLDPFIPEVILAEQGADLILGQMVIDAFAESGKKRGLRTYVMFEGPTSEGSDKYVKYGRKFHVGSNDYTYYLPNAINVEKKESKILIFDAYAKTGATLRTIKAKLKELGFNNVRTAVVGASTKQLDENQEPDHICILSDTYWDSIPTPLPRWLR
jgi:hypothetical protein